jgi:hypothetical protein
LHIAVPVETIPALDPTGVTRHSCEKHKGGGMQVTNHGLVIGANRLQFVERLVRILRAFLCALSVLFTCCVAGVQAT